MAEITLVARPAQLAVSQPVYLIEVRPGATIVQSGGGGGGGGSVAWEDITGKPPTFPPQPHGHPLSDVAGLQGALDGKADVGHGHALASSSTAGFMAPADKAKLDGVAAGATANASDADLRDRSTHTGTQPVSTITGLAAIATSGSAADLTTGTLPAARFDDTAHGNRGGGTLHAAATGAAAGFMSAADKAKLDGVAAGATANATDAELRDRATHTGTQPASTITGLAAIATSGSAADLTSGTLPAARFDDTSHGSRGGGSLHAAATGSTAGFISAADKAKLDGIATGANNYTHPNHTGDVTSVGDGATTIANDAVTDAKLRNSAALSVIGRASNSTGDPGDIAAGTDGHVLRRSGTTLGFGEVATAGIADNAVTNAKLADMAANTVKANATAATADPSDLAVGTNTVVGRQSGNIVAAQVVTAQIADDAVTNAKLANVSSGTIKGRASTGAGDPEDLTGTQATALLDVFTSSAKGLAPASGGGTTNFLRADGTWAAPPGGGGGSGDVTGPSSSTANALARFDGTTGKTIKNSAVTLSDSGELTLPVVTNPAAPSTDNLNLYAARVANRMMPGFLAPSGFASAVQPLLAHNKIALWQVPGNGVTVPAVIGINAMSTLGTATGRNVSTANMASRTRRIGYNSASTAGSVAGMRQTVTQISLGDGSGLGGFFWSARFVIATHTTDANFFIGVTNSTTAPGGTTLISSLTNCIGVGFNASMSNFNLVYGGSTLQSFVDFGSNFPARTSTADLYELNLYAPPNVANTCYYEFRRLNTGHTASGTLSGNSTVLPQSGTLLSMFNSFINNQATASAVSVDYVSLYVETDY